MHRPTRLLDAILDWISSILVLLAVLLLSAPAARAATMSFASNLTFNAPTQSMWGPGKSSASFGTTGNTGYVGIVVGDARVQWDFSASSGTVGSTVRGALGATYESEVSRNTSTPISVGFTPGSSSFATDLGARADLQVRFRDLPLGIPDQTLCLYCKSYSLDTSRSFTSNLGTNRSDTGSFAAAGLGVDLLVAGLEASLNVTQRANFRPDAVSGLLRATHVGTGDSFTRSFVLDQAMSTSVLDVSFDKGGLWDLSFLGLDLASTFSTVFGASITATAWYDYLINSGSTTIPIGALSLFSSPSFALDFNTLSTGSFQVMVPEPGTAMLLALGLAGLAVAGRREFLRS